jgi:hypothetical protein
VAAGSNPASPTSVLRLGSIGTLSKVSQWHACEHRGAHSIRAMRFTILLRVDRSGSTPVLLEGNQRPDAVPDGELRFVALVDKRAIAEHVVELMRAKGLAERQARQRSDAVPPELPASAATPPPEVR